VFESSENQDLPENSERPESHRIELADVVNRALVQMGDMDAIQDRLRGVSDRLSKVTPLPREPASPAGNE
jgi:hypothetical protein